MSKSCKVKVCRVCLRSDVRTRHVDSTLSDFYDELCEYDTYENKSLRYCAMCEFQLKKCYHFKQRCQRGNAVLKAWRKKKLTAFPKTLHRLIPPLSITYSTPSSQHTMHYTYSDHGPTIDYSQSGTSKDYGQRNSTDYSQSTLTEYGYSASIDFGQSALMDIGPRMCDRQSDKDSDSDLDVPLSSYSQNIQAAPIDIGIDIKDIQLKVESQPPSSPSVSDFNGEDFDDDDSELDLAMDRYIKTESTKPTRKATKLKKTLKSNKMDTNSKTDLQDEQNIKKFVSTKEKVEELLENGEICDLGDNVSISREVFVKIYDKFLMSDLRMLSLKKDSQGQYTKLKKALQHLLKKYNPDYETVFDIEYLDTEDKKLNEFARRKSSKSYTDASFKCELCYRGFEKQTQFDYHNKWHTESAGEFCCGICGMRFQSLKTRASHRASSHSAVYSCKMCPLVTYHYPVMLNHYEQHKGVEYSCPICLSVFENKTTFMNHQRDHNADKKKSVCTSCACTFISDVGLMLHRKSKHTDATPTDSGPHSTCNECNVVFDSQEVYMKHVALSHTKKAESHRCAYCHIRFSTLEELRAHKVSQGHQRASKKYAQRTARSNLPNPVKKIKINTPDEPFVKCELCPAMVSTAFTSCMYKHFLKEHPDIPYSSVYSQTARRLLCHLCGKTFMDPAFFADHANVHSGLRPYVCALCPARFHSRRHLGLHAPRHQPATHACQLCHKRFHSAANLYNHRKTHIGDRRFKCEICLKGFLHAATLNEHVRGVHHHIRKQKNRKETY